MDDFEKVTAVFSDDFEQVLVGLGLLEVLDAQWVQPLSVPLQEYS